MDLVSELKKMGAVVEPPAETTEPGNGEQTQTQTEAPAAAQTEGQAEAGKEKEVTAPPAPDRYAVLSEVFGREFKGDEDIETFRSSLTGYENQLNEYKTREAQWLSEKEELSKAVNPREWFANDELFIVNALLKKFPDKSPMALTQISATDYSKTYIDNPVEVLALDLMLEHPGIYTSKTEAVEDVLARYNVTDPEELTEQAKRLMKVDAKSAADKFTKLKSEIELPKPVDRSAEITAKTQAETERQNKIKEATDPLFSKTIPQSLKAVEIPVTIKDEAGKEVTEIAFSYEIPESYAKSKAVQGIIDQVRQATIRNEAEWTKEKEARLKEDVTNLLLANYYWQNRTEIYTAMRTDLQTKFADEAWMKRHNVRGIRQDGRPEKVDPKQAEYDKNQADLAKRLGYKL